ncbi:conjugal transfer protein TraD [Azospirillum sp.]|uniref:conjugal transfer protein TraD n=1 Tax=Azospirillum sp. TaxID=34012 RepID=UPI002D6470ED|nr:conjugal transfer protein TraD [Azospirillum sp.]HYD63938.1 conjugal transfer protein TraD [Azospirillum sp.]
MVEPAPPSPDETAEARPAPGSLTTISVVQERIAKINDIPARTRTVEDQAYLVALRKRLHDLRGVRLASEEAKVREAQRKAETRRKIQLGGLVIKAGLDGWDEATLLGALLEVREGAADLRNGPSHLARWKASGGKALTAEKAVTADREPLIVTFPNSPEPEIRRALRGLKLRWSEALQHWDGLAHFTTVKAIADRAGGTIRRLNPPQAETPGG